MDVNESIDQCLVMLSESISRLGIQVLRSLGAVPPVQGDGSELNQVFLNVITNSIDAIEETGTGHGLITVQTRTDSGDVVIDIADNGAGIPEAILPRIFDPFFTTKPPGKGQGSVWPPAMASSPSTAGGSTSKADPGREPASASGYRSRNRSK